jgi:hypothetical protein
MSDTKNGAQQLTAQLISKGFLYASIYNKLLIHLRVSTSSAEYPNVISNVWKIPIILALISIF